ncbi:MAG: heme A synthase [Methylocystaceae bacterium]|jgi:heme a synthase|nr:heme A synthase [Methylocystaceae bacterium]NBT96563.1 heme A synthase [Methylocystaceae bacterium]
MEDWLQFPEPAPAIRHYVTAQSAGAVRNWLFLVAGLVFLMVIVGGATRLTESGLSIVEWKPITGVIPPLSDKDWAQAFEDYQQIPQYKELFPQMDLSGFKYIYAWEWGHRLLARLIGLVFFIPLVLFWLKNLLPPGVKPKLLLILALGALQGGVGWWMVSSGLVHRTEVAQERLAIHLIIAALIFASCIWVAGGLGSVQPIIIHEHKSRLRLESILLMVFTCLQIFLGGLVAGLRAGLVNNSWPLIDGVFIPSSATLWALDPWWINLLNNPLTVQFIHRMTAYVLFLIALTHLIDSFLNTEGKLKRGAIIVFLHIIVQIILGIATLILVEPPFNGAPHILLALGHQAVAMAVLAVVTLQTRRLLSS